MHNWLRFPCTCHVRNERVARNFQESGEDIYFSVYESSENFLQYENEFWSHFHSRPLEMFGNDFLTSP
jgi:hypothetical protein